MHEWAKEGGRHCKYILSYLQVHLLVAVLAAVELGVHDPLRLARVVVQEVGAVDLLVHGVAVVGGLHAPEREPLESC